MNDLYIMHYSVGHDKGGHSGRYPWGSGKNPYGGTGTKSTIPRKSLGKAIARAAFVPFELPYVLQNPEAYMWTKDVGNEINKKLGRIWRKGTGSRTRYIKRLDKDLKNAYQNISGKKPPIGISGEATDYWGTIWDIMEAEKGPKKKLQEKIIREVIKNNPKKSKQIADNIRKKEDSIHKIGQDYVKKLSNKYDLRTLVDGRNEDNYNIMAVSYVSQFTHDRTFYGDKSDSEVLQYGFAKYAADQFNKVRL